MKNIILKITAIAIGLFALLTIFMSGSVIFDLFGIRAKEGDYVLFVVVLNFICGFLYLIAAYGFFAKKAWTMRLLLFSVGILVVSFVGLMWHINAGGSYEMGTVKALIFRFFVTGLFAGMSWHYLSKNGYPKHT